MAGIYIHIPFCRQKCHYCNFFSLASQSLKDPFLETLRKEIRLQEDYFQDQTVNTLYFGGGTPSLLSSAEIQNILDEINRHFPVAADAEISMEANPDDLDPFKIKEYLTAGINRFSLGVQSFFDEDLKFLNRRHDTLAAISAINNLQEAGIGNISIDLIYGIPGLSLQKWEQNIETFFSFHLPHLSAYSLTIEPKTALDVLIRKKKMPSPVEEEAIDHFNLLMEKMQEAGYEHYEISNFAKDGQYSRHNSNYWKGVHYLGLGPSAHSYNGASRQWNVTGLKEYISRLNEADRWYEKEILSLVQKYNEYVMTSLRTSWGCDTKKIISDFACLPDRQGFCQSAGQAGILNFFRKQASQAIDNGLLYESSGIYFLTAKGKLFADGIAADLFLEEEGGS